MADCEQSFKGKTLFVRNIPLATNKDELTSLFSEIGPVKDCFIVKEKGTTKSRGFGYVTFALREDAAAAESKALRLAGQLLSTTFADNKFKKGKKQPAQSKEKNKAQDAVLNAKSQAEQTSPDAFADTSKKPTKKKKMKSPTSKVDEPNALMAQKEAAATLVLTGFKEELTKAKLDSFLKQLQLGQCKLVYPVPDRMQKTAFLKLNSRQEAIKANRLLTSKALLKFGQIEVCRLSQEKIRNLAANSKQSRLIIRNLSFKCTEQVLREQFSKFGAVTEVKIPKKKDGKMFGFGFVQMQSVTDANRAIQEMNSTEILGRPVAVDWAVAKDKFVASVAKQTDVKPDEFTVEADEEEHEKEETKMDTEEMETDDDNQESSEEDEEEMDVDIEDDESEDDKEEEEEEIDDEDGSEEESDDDEEDDDEDNEGKKKKMGQSKDVQNKARKQQKNDVTLGQTLFIRNVPFSCEDEDLSEVFEEFGEVNYCLILRDKQTEQPKGMAFVQFRTKSAADDCIKASEESQSEGLVMDGRRLKVTLALSREQTQQLRKAKKEPETKDKRNLHLVREGMIRAGTQAAQSLSREDILKREKIEAVKRQKLKKPDVFVSETRLCVHNLPISLGDSELRKVFCRAADDPKARITECRIMRDLDKVNSQGVGKSRGYAFVNFTQHSHALAALRSTNNNPDIFGEKRKPIVEFSLENKAALVAKEKRLERMKAKEEMLKKTGVKRQQQQQQQLRSDKKNKIKSMKESQPLRESGSKASDVTARGAKGIKSLPSHRGPKLRHKPRGTEQNTGKKVSKKRKQAASSSKQPSAKKLKMAPTKKRKKQKTDSFDQLVNKYRNASSGTQQRKKGSARWFNS